MGSIPSRSTKFVRAPVHHTVRVIPTRTLRFNSGHLSMWGQPVAGAGWVAEKAPCIKSRIIGLSYSGSIAGSNPAGWGSIPHGPAKFKYVPLADWLCSRLQPGRSWFDSSGELQFIPTAKFRATSRWVSARPLVGFQRRTVLITLNKIRMPPMTSGAING
jgi:hypothetical protein